jgi:shikimate 5-dehydrogenase
MSATEPGHPSAAPRRPVMSATEPARYGLLGFPLGHSLSPQIHHRLMDAAGINGTYELVATASEDLDDQLKHLVHDFDGFNITISSR